MSRIRIKNFGPIKEGVQDNGWVDISKVTVFIGNQGSGKSTVAKLISTFLWMEKALVRGDYNSEWFHQKNQLRSQFLSYHRLENYLKNNGGKGTFIEFDGIAYHILYENGELTINEKSGDNYPLPQIMYVPAERNFLAYVKSPKELKLSSEPLTEFLTEYDNAKEEIKGIVELPINGAGVEYDKFTDTLDLKGDDYRIKLSEASSGFQSLVPVYLVSAYLANSVRKQSEVNTEPMSSDEMKRFRAGVEKIWKNDSLTDDQKRIALSVLSSRFNKTAFINIVEEPEQNLFPISQRELLHGLLHFNNFNDGNRLILTTHSPYLVNYLTIAIKANEVKAMLKKYEDFKRLSKIVPLESTIKPEELNIYEMDEKAGSIRLLRSYNGLPSDENELNEQLDEGNEMFAQLLEIQQSL